MKRHLHIQSYCLLIFVVLLPRFVHSQERRIESGKTIIEVELLMPRMGGGILAPQQWGQAFEKIGQSVQIRAALEGDKAGVTEQIRGTLRFVKVVGVIDRDDKLLVGNKAYSLNDTGKLKVWLDELKVYGAQGSPSGQPLWGLTKEQFTVLFASLAQPVEKFESQKTVLEEIAQLSFPEELPVKFHRSLDESLIDGSPAVGEPKVTGLTVGTALAVLLSQRGLGFRPLRTPDGSIELIVEKLDDIIDPWPIGWDVAPDKSPGDALPQLFRIEPLIGLEPQPLETALSSIAENVPVPVVIDYRRCLSIGVDPRTKSVKYTYKRTAWGIVLKSVLRENQLNYSLRNDEQGQTFLYIHPFEKTTVPPK